MNVNKFSGIIISIICLLNKYIYIYTIKRQLDEDNEKYFLVNIVFLNVEYVCHIYTGKLIIKCSSYRKFRLFHILFLFVLHLLSTDILKSN